jgi:hypothetical protein
MKSRLAAAVAGIALMGGLGSWIWQKQRAAELEMEVTGLRRAGREIAIENAQLRESAEQTQREAASQVRQEVEQTLRQVASMEVDWQRMIAPRPQSEAPFTSNRDPTKGPVRVAHFRNVGQATPAAAFQTLIWALANDSEVVMSLLAISPVGREKLHAMVARMAPEKQARFHPPEKVVGMLLTFDLLKEDGFAIGAASEPDAAGVAMLVVDRARGGRTNAQEKKFPLQRGPSGWQMPIPDALIDSIPGALESLSMYVPPKLPKK